MALADVHSRVLMTAQTMSSPFTLSELRDEFIKNNPDVSAPDLAMSVSILIEEGFVLDQLLLTPKGMGYDPDDN